MDSWWAKAGALVAAALLGGVVAVGLGQTVDSGSTTTVVREIQNGTTEPAAFPASAGKKISDIYEAAKHGVVQVTSTSVVSNNFFGAQEQQARKAKLRVVPYRSDSERKHGYAKAYLRQRFRDEFGGDHPPDWRVDTTFVAQLQDAAEQAIENGLRRAGKPTLQAALVAVDPATGNILAMVGGRDYSKSAFNRASRSRRQP